jgi:hypothetical protein
MFALNAAGIINAANHVSIVNGIASAGNKVLSAQINAIGPPIKINVASIKTIRMFDVVGFSFMID